MRKRLTTIRRIFWIGLRNFFRNAWLSTAATAVMFVALTILLSAFAFNSALNDTIKEIANKVTLSVYLNDDASQAETSALERALYENEFVDEINFIDKQEALLKFQQDNQDDPELLQGIGLTDNVFPASFEVRVDDLSQLQSVIDIAESDTFSEAVEETSANQKRLESINNIAKAQDFIVLASLGAAGVFAGISVLIIFNTIRMAIFTRSEEIQIMKLIGATPGYIRGPFLLEASLYGVIAAVLSYAAVYGVLLGIGPSSNYLVMDPTIDFFVDLWYVIFAIMLGLGVLIGFLSSGLALTRYLRLKSW